jgi:hypothetical protein
MTWSVRYRDLSKSKAVPLHAMEALGERGGIAPTHSLTSALDGVSGQHHASSRLVVIPV